MPKPKTAKAAAPVKSSGWKKTVLKFSFFGLVILAGLVLLIHRDHLPVAIKDNKAVIIVYAWRDRAVAAIDKDKLQPVKEAKPQKGYSETDRSKLDSLVEGDKKK